MKKKLATLALVLGLSVAGSMSAFAGEWKQDNIGWWYQNDDGSYPVNNWTKIDEKWYQFDGNGYMVTHGNWEGGFIAPDGSLFEDLMYIDTNYNIQYTRGLSYDPELFAIGFGMENMPLCSVDENGAYYGTIAWKNQLITAWANAMGGFEAYGNYKLDFQLPADWKSQVPEPILSTCIDEVCLIEWGGLGYVNWNFTWNVDENYVLHIDANYFPVEETTLGYWY